LSRRAFTVLTVACLCTPATVRAQERVDLQVPGRLAVKAFIAGTEVATPPSHLAFTHAMLLPGRRLRISVRAEGPENREGIRALSFVTTNAIGGAGLRGTVGWEEWSPVFEGRTLAVSGGVEILWKIEMARWGRRAGDREIALRWRIESVANGADGIPAPPIVSDGREPRGPRSPLGTPAPSSEAPPPRSAMEKQRPVPPGP
jgi:hypothetical protein